MQTNGGGSAQELSPLKKAFLAIDRLQARVRELEEGRQEPIAVVGLACRFPGGASSPDRFSELLRDATDAVVAAPPVPRPGLNEAIARDHLPPAGYLREDVAAFDPVFFGVAPREAASMDPQQRLVLECAWQALEDAAINPRGLEGSRTGVFVGVAATDWSQLQMRGVPTAEAIHPHFAAGVGHSMASGRISYLLGLQGPSVSLDTACSSSLVSLHLACQSLRAKECDLALGAGVNLILAPDFTIAFQQTRMLSEDGRCRTFDADATGFTRGEGCGVVVLKRLKDALRDGDRIHAVIRGSAVNQDGPSSGLTAPNGPAQEAVIRAALEAAALSPRDVDLVEAHGTGTILGDPIEVQALGATYGRERDGAGPLTIGSVKTNLGHLEAAAGMAGFIKAVLAVRDDFIPAQLHFSTPNPHIPWDRLPVRVATEAARFPEGRIRRAGVSSFGFSGTNAHVIVEEPPVATSVSASASGPTRGTQVLPLSAVGDTALRELVADVAAMLEADADSFADVAHTAAVGRAPLRHRVAVAAESGAEGAAALRAWLAGGEAAGLFAGRVSPEPPSVAFLYTGQGSQRPGMARELYEQEPVVREVLDRAAAVLDGELGRPFLPLLFGQVDDPDALHRTAAAQPAIMAVELALSALWRSWGIRPDRLLGHSVGEYAAAVDAGIVSFEDGLRLIAARGRLMDALPEGGAMVALFCGADRIRPLLGGEEAQVSIAAINAPDSTVISGEEGAALEIAERLAADGVQYRRLNVSHAFHSRRMEPMLDEFRRMAASIRFSPPRITVISNVTGRALTAAEAVDPEYWVRHVRAPVLFHEGVEAARAAGVELFLEVGPEGTLCGMASRFLPEEVRCVASLRSKRTDGRALAEATAALFVAGVVPDWKRRDEGRALRRVALPISRFERSHLWYALPSSAAATLAASGPAWQSSGHPILGAGIRTPDGARIFERTLDTDTVLFIADHRVDGRVIVPATVHVELLLAAGRAATGRDDLMVEGVTIREAMVLEADSPRSLMVRVEPAGEGDARRATIHSLAEGDEEFRLHAEGTLVADARAGAPALERAEAETRCTERIDAGGFYRRLAERGLDFGPTFQGVAEVRFTDGEALATLVEADGLEGGYRLHPATLDAAIQGMAVAIPAGTGSADLFLPVEIGRVRYFEGAGAAGYAHARVQRGKGGGRTLTGSVLVHDEQGRPVASIDEIRLVPVADRRPAGEESPVYRVGWEARPRVGAATEALLAVAGATLTARAEETGAAVYDALHRDLESLSADFFLRALRQLGWEPRVGEGIEVAGLMEVCGILPRHERLVRRILRVLEGVGMLSSRGDAAWRIEQDRDPGDPDARAAELIARYAPHDAELTVTARCGAGLADVLRGAADPLELLFPGGDTFAQSRVYRDTPIAHSFNGAIAALVREMAHRRRAGSPLRILEIGAGTGGTTAHVLAALPDDGVEYTFTDIGRLFVNRARESFGDRPFMRFETLDIDRAPEEQGFEPESYDLVIASNVLHATRLLRPTLQRVRHLLAPDGHLCLFEVTRERGWVDLTVGLLEGWWLYEDTDLRVENPVLDRAGWESLLESEGFVSAGGTDETQSGGGLEGQSIILARRPAVETSTRAAWLVFGAGDPAAEAFAARLASDGAEVRVERRPDRAATPATLAEALSAAPAPLTDVVLFWPASGGGEQGVDALRPGLGGALALVQALVRREGDPPRLHLVTRGGQAASGDVERVDPAQATAWGLARSVRLEHPELRCRCIDLDPARAGWSEAAHLELASPDAEEEVAFRGSERRVARLIPVELPAPRVGARRLVYGSNGLLEDLRLDPVERRAPDPHEIEVEVLAAGLNFRDVVHALGVRKDVEALGTECVGRVVARGDAVEHLAEGDLVVAAGGRFGDFTTLAADLAVRLPDGLSLLEAATLPIAYLTAHRALHGVARMHAGQRILIHAAAGGVGMAAVQLAVAAGLEVYGTAGTEAKRELVRTLGARGVFDSRSLSFEEELLRETGGAGVDLVLNSLAGDFIPASLRVIADGGQLIELGKTGIWTQDRVDAEPGVHAGVRYLPVDLSDDLMERPAVIRPVLQEIVDRVAAGELHPLPVRSFPLSRAEDAFRLMAAGRHTGKVVLVADERLPVREDGSYLITGGFGGLGLLVAERLADRGARSIVLLGRSEPGADAREVMGRLRARGIRVEAVRADVADGAAVRHAIASLDELPPLRGVVHSAGALRDGALVQQSWGDFAEVLASKTAGVETLASVGEGKPIDFFLIFSSIAGTLGSPGQANHSAANAFLDAYAVDRVARGLPAVSIAWGAWGEVGAAVRHGVNTRAAGRGIGTIDPADGLRLMEMLGAGGLPVAMVSPIRWDRFLADAVPAPFFERVAPVRRRRVAVRASTARPAAEPGAGDAGQTKRTLAEELAELPPARRRAALKERIRGAVRRVLGLPAGFELEDRQALGDIGLDSLMAVELRNALGSMVGRSLPATLLFDYPTVGALTGYIEPSVAPAEAPAATASGDDAAGVTGTGGDDELDDLLGQIENLSETEVAHRVRKVESSPHV